MQEGFIRWSAPYLEINFDLWSTTVFWHLKILLKLGLGIGVEQKVTDDDGLTNKRSALLYAVNRSELNVKA